MAIQGHIQGSLVHLAVRAIGALRTASPPHHLHHLRWVLLAFMLAMVVMLVERAVHHDLGPHGPVALAAVGWPQAWGAYREHLLHKGLAASSIGQYRFRLNTWRYWLWHPPRGRHRKDWWQANPGDLTAFLARKCAPRHVNAGRPMSQATRAMYSSSIPPLYHTCYAKGLIDADPMAGYEPLPPPRPAPRPLDLDQVAKLLRYAEQHPDPRLHVAVCLCFFDALRAGEPTELTTDDMMLGAGVTGAGVPQINVLGKGHKDRDWFPLHPAVVPAMQRYLGWLASRHGVSSWWDLPAGTPLFQSLTKVGAPIGRSYLSRLLARAMREAGVRGRPHDLRRTAANLVAEAYDDNPGPLKAVLRHRGYTSLESYRVPSLGRVQQYLDAIPVPDPLEGQATAPT